MNENLKVLLMNALMAAIAASVWLALMRFARMPWAWAWGVYGIAAAILFVSLCAVCTGRRM